MHERAIKVLLVEDNDADAQIALDMLALTRGPSCDVTRVTRIADAHAQLSIARYAVTLLDLGLPDASGLECVRTLLAAAPATAIIVLSGLGDERRAVEAVEAGATDYLVKGRADDDALRRSIRFAIARRDADIAQRRFTAIIESSEDAILTKDLDAIITSWNPGAERLYGYTRAEALGRSVAMLVPADREHEEHELVARVLRG